MHLLRSVRSAFAFFSRLPVGPWRLQDSLAGIAVWLPLVGLALGALVGFTLYGLNFLFPPLVCGILACAAWVMFSGGLHLDGVADCGDALPVELPPARRLAIMQDSRLGTFGGVALFFVLSCKIACLSHLVTNYSPFPLILVCCLAALLARTQVFFAMRFPSARPGGLGHAIKQGVRPLHTYIALFFCLCICLLCGFYALIAMALTIVVACVLLCYACSRLGGVTGDVFGCMIELCECVVLLFFCLPCTQLNPLAV